MQPPSGLSVFDVPDPTPLPSAPLLAHWAFEAPLLPVLFLLLAGAGAFLFLNSRARLRDASLAALGAAIAAATLLISASLVTTPRETLRELTRSLVAATARADGPAVGALLAPECVLVMPVSHRELGPAEISDEVSQRIREFAVNDHALLELQAFDENNRFARVQVKVRVSASQSGPVLSWWRIEFENDGAGNWRVLRITPLAISGLSGV